MPAAEATSSRGLFGRGEELGRSYRGPLLHNGNTCCIFRQHYYPVAVVISALNEGRVDGQCGKTTVRSSVTRKNDFARAIATVQPASNVMFPSKARLPNMRTAVGISATNLSIVDAAARGNRISERQAIRNTPSSSAIHAGLLPTTNPQRQRVATQGGDH